MANKRSDAYFFPLIVLISVNCIIYANSIGSPFILDDDIFILNDRAIRLTELTVGGLVQAAVNGNPPRRLLPNLSFAINYYFGRYDVTGYHLVNIFIHLITGIILFFFFQTTLALIPNRCSRAGFNRQIAFWAALLWLVHPVGTQSVTYICQRMTSIAALFYMLCLLMYAKARILQRSISMAGLVSDPHTGPPPSTGKGTNLFVLLWFAGAILSGLAAVASKENAGMLPVFILLYEWFFFQDLKIKWSLKKIFWMLAAAMIFGMIVVEYLGLNPVARILSGYAHRDFTLGQRVMTEWRVVVYYISLFFYPISQRLSLEHDYPLSHSVITPWTTGFCLIAILSLLIFIIYAAPKHRLAAFCTAWFLGNLVIESSVIGIEIIFEHRTYLPFIMPCLMAALGIYKSIKSPKAAAGFLGFIILLLAVSTYHRNMTWKDPIALLQDCVIKAPQEIRPRLNLATELQLKGESETARRHLETILSQDPYCLNAYTNLANIWASQNHLEKAVEIYLAALGIPPQRATAKTGEFATPYFNLGSIFLHRRMIEEAVFFLETGLTQNPNNADAHALAGLARLQNGDKDLAKRHFHQALTLDPQNVLAKSSLAQLSRRPPDARNQAKHPAGQEVYAENIPLHLMLGQFFQKQNNCKQAENQFRRVLELHPEHQAAKDGLKACTSELLQP